MSHTVIRDVQYGKIRVQYAKIRITYDTAYCTNTPCDTSLY